MLSVTQPLETGQTVRPIRSAASRATSAASSRQLTPWSIRSTPISSRHCQMCPTASSWSTSQCIVSR